MQAINFKQSRDWGKDKPISWLIANAKFSFTHAGHNGSRPHIVIDKELDKYNVFELDVERYGVVIKGNSSVDESRGAGESIPADKTIKSNVSELLKNTFCQAIMFC